MPIYERRCECGVKFTHLSKVADREAPVRCPGCGSLETAPVLSPTKTTFKHADKSGMKERGRL